MVTTRKRRAIETQNAVQAAVAGEHSLGDDSAPNSRQVVDALLALPFDILMEVLNQAKPQDLLNLSRLNKAWRATMRGGNINSRAVWTTVRRNYGIPEPPRGLTEPQWASLWLETWCQRFPDYPEEYLDYVPQVLRSKQPHCWDEDVQAVAQLFAKLTPSALEMWKSNRIAALEERKAKHDDTTKAYEAWQIMKKVEKNVLALESIKASFLKQGTYQAVDIEIALSLKNPKVAVQIQNPKYTISTLAFFGWRYWGDWAVREERDKRIRRERDNTLA
ncbi:hypothetical protein NMY22_g17905 [Coprinellus aureogranulatus]|nr:hypothetical protein NMY22_g17905 [Coprinellus aureogranulatus]